MSCFLKVLSDNNTNTKPYKTHHKNNQIFEHLNPNAITRRFVVVDSR